MGRKKDMKLAEEKMQDLSFNQLKEKLQAVIDRLNQLVSRVTEKTDLAVFLTVICKDFEFDMKDNWENVTVITIDDKLEALKYGYFKKIHNLKRCFLEKKQKGANFVAHRTQD